MQILNQFIGKEICLKCQGCCRFAQQESIWLPQLLKDEEARIAPYTKKIQTAANPGQGNFTCQFLTTGDNKCKIYTIRPFECQLYPFLLNSHGKKVYLAVDLKCPYIKHGTHIEEYKKHVEYLTAFFNRPDTISTLKNNPQVIQQYEHVLDIVELRP